MELVPIACHNCGAPLQIPPQADLVTCQHCLTQLAVCRNESVAWTEALEELDERTELLAETAGQLDSRLARIEYQRSLDSLSRRWDAQQAHGRNGTDDPMMQAAVGAAGLLFTGGILGLAWSSTLTFVLFAGGAAFAFWMGVKEDNQRRMAKQRYATARAAIHTQFFAQHPMDTASSGKAFAYPGLPGLDEPSQDRLRMTYRVSS